MSLLHYMPYMLGHCFLIHKLTTDTTCGRQQLLTQVSVHRPWLPDTHSAAHFRHLSPSLCAKTAFCSDVIILCCSGCLQSVILWIFQCSWCDSFLSLKHVKITSFSNCFEQLSLARRFASITSPAGVSFNTSNQDHGEKMIRTTSNCVI